MPKPPTDPYAPPPRHRDKSGRIVRVVILGLMLVGAGLGYSYFTSHSAPPVTEEQQFSDASDVLPPAPPVEPAITPETTPAPAPQRESAPRRELPPPVDQPPEVAPMTPIAPSPVEPLPPVTP